MNFRGKHLAQFDFLTGRLVLKRGTRADYKSLERFHYLAGPPATFTQIWTIYHESQDPIPPDLRAPVSICSSPRSVPIAIAVLSHPCLNSHARDRALNLSRLPRKERIKFINKNIRTLSRLIVHPAYRGLGLASILIQCILHNCPTRYTESLSTIARAHPLFKKSGMQEFLTNDDTKPHYYLFDKNSSVSSVSFVFSVAEPTPLSSPSKSSDTAANHR